MPAGSFEMGSPESEAGRSPDEGPRRQAHILEDFWLMRTPVTREQYATATDSSGLEQPYFPEGLPATGVNWAAVVELCQRLNGLPPDAGGPPAGWGFALPTEAQWEYACRAGSRGPFGVGAGLGLSGVHANFDAARAYGDVLSLPSNRVPTPVGSFPPNAWGFCDFHGNVWEWCADLWASNYFFLPPEDLPESPSLSRRRALRGGDWRASGRDCRCASRNHSSGLSRDPGYGFRLALIPGPALPPWFRPVRASRPMSEPKVVETCAAGETTEELMVPEIRSSLTQAEWIRCARGRDVALVIPGDRIEDPDGLPELRAASEEGQEPVAIGIHGEGELPIDLEALRSRFQSQSVLVLDTYVSIRDSLGGAARSDLDQGPIVLRKPESESGELSDFFRRLLIDGGAGRLGGDAVSMGEFASFTDPLSGFGAVFRHPDWADRALIGNSRRWRIPLPGGQWLALLWVPSGRFTMGSPEGEAGRCQNEGPRCAVEIDPGFWMGQTPVTQGQYRAVMQTNPSVFKESGDDAPVENVSYRDAAQFCERLQKLCDEKRITPDGAEESWNFLLPTEAQWEYSCRAGEEGPFSVDSYGAAWVLESGDAEGGPYSAESLPDYFDGTSSVWTPVRNRWGFYNMHGNVWEWCRDSFDPEGGQRNQPVADPKDQSPGEARVVRGGSWLNVVKHHRCAFRYGHPESQRGNDIGFRIVLVSGVSPSEERVSRNQEGRARGFWARLFRRNG